MCGRIEGHFTFIPVGVLIFNNRIVRRTKLSMLVYDYIFYSD